MADSSSSITPEKRLLNLIESGGKGEASQGPGASAARSVRPAFSGASAKFDFANFPEQVKVFFLKLPAKFGLKKVNKTAQVILAGLALLTMGNAVYEMKILGRDPFYGLDVPGRKVTPIEIEEPDFDASKIQSNESRNVFVPFAKREEMKAAQPTTSGGGGRLVEMTKTLKLTGISYNPDDAKTTYCMIEDLQKNITVFLRIGDRISGMKVGKITDESVELEYENDKIEIR